MNGKQLKNSILQWAIQGKLVPQDQRKFNLSYFAPYLLINHVIIILSIYGR